MRSSLRSTSRLLITLFVLSWTFAGSAETIHLVVDARPVTVIVPDAPSPEQPMPVLMALHGYGGNGPDLADSYYLTEAAEQAEVVLILPEGTRDPRGYPFWNAGDACCNFFDRDVDDVAFLSGLPDIVAAELAGRVSLDLSRVYLFGLSNGGFMAYRLACEHPSRFAALVNVAGAMDATGEDCRPLPALGVLHVHGTADETILFDGGELIGSLYTSVEETLEVWRKAASCDMTWAVEVNDLDAKVPGRETRTLEDRCAPGVRVSLWEVNGAAHEPAVRPSFGAEVLAFLFAHQRVVQTDPR